MWRNFTRNYRKIFKLLNVRYQGEPLGCNILILTMIFSMNFLICSARLMALTVVLCFQTNQNMDVITV